MKTRILSAIVALPILIYILFKGGLLLYLGAGLIALIGLYEFYRVFSKKQSLLSTVGYVTTVIWFAFTVMGIESQYLGMLMAAFVFFTMGVMVFSNHSLQSVAFTILGFFYVSFPMSHIVLISKLDQSFFIWYPFIIAFVTDTFAYFMGKIFGKHKLIPTVSPNKTIEGAIGGALFGTLFSFAYSALFFPEFKVYAIFLGLVGSVLSQIGDLIASKIKRLYDIKDYGKIMPGHGGVLDRFDGVIITMPLVYYFMVVFDSIHNLLVF